MEPKGFFATLFDLSFTSLITTRIVQILYVIGLVFAGIYTLVVLAIAFDSSTGAGIIALIFSPVIFLLFAIIARVYMEILIVIFRIAEHAAEIAYNTRGGSGQPAAPSASPPPTTYQSQQPG
jgi:hypothetical protein